MASRDRKGTAPIAGAATSIAAFVGTAARGRLRRSVRVRSFAEFARAFGPASGRGTLGPAARLFFENGGREALVVRVAKIAEVGKGLHALRRAELNVLILPGVRALRAALVLAKRRRAILLVDPPKSADTAAKAIAWARTIPRDGNAAAYFPRLTDSPASGAIAGIYARTDRERGVWKAPAGTSADIRASSGLALTLSSAEIDALSAQGVNALRTLPGKRTCVWGARTLDGGYVSVRRLTLFLERSLACATERKAIEDFLLGLFRQGAFAGRKPEEAFYVRSDPMEIEIGFAPLRPAEFVVLRFGLAGGC